MLHSRTFFIVENVLEDCLDLIPSPSLSVKIQIMGRKVVNNAQQCLKKKNRKFKCSWLLEGDGIESRLPFKIFSTLNLKTSVIFFRILWPKETTSQKSHFESFLYGMWQNPIYARRKKAILHFTYDKKLHSTLLQLAQVQ